MHTPLGPLAFWEGYEAVLFTLLTYAIGLALYAMLVGLFYITLSQRDLIASKGDGKRPGAFGFLLIFPLVSFGLFLVLSVALFFLAKQVQGVPEAQRVQDLLTLSMALVMGVRVTAYVSDQAAVDLAKLVPLGLLGVLLVDPGFLTIEAPLARLAMLPSLVDLIGRMLIVLILLEFGLRFLWVLSGGPSRARAKALSAASPQPGPGPHHR